jgi:hypothetical protein
MPTTLLPKLRCKRIADRSPPPPSPSAKVKFSKQAEDLTIKSKQLKRSLILLEKKKSQQSQKAYADAIDAARKFPKEAEIVQQTGSRTYREAKSTELKLTTSQARLH